MTFDNLGETPGSKLSAYFKKMAFWGDFQFHYEIIPFLQLIPKNPGHSMGIFPYLLNITSESFVGLLLLFVFLLTYQS